MYTCNVLFDYGSNFNVFWGHPRPVGCTAALYNTEPVESDI